MMILDRIALILVIIGALNWGSVGLFRFDAVAWICGGLDLRWRGNATRAHHLHRSGLGRYLVHLADLPLRG